MNKEVTAQENRFNSSSFIPQPFKIASILLAAGESRRLGNAPKQLLEFREKTLLRGAVENALASECWKVCVVLGANAGKLKSEISDLPVEIAVNENWRRGMSWSLKCGLKKTLEIAPEISAVVVTLADQPLIDAAVINRLVETFQQTRNPIVAAAYAETIGVPAVFARSVFDEILNLTDESGAKQLIEKYGNSVEKIFIPEAAFDVDTREDYEKLLKLEKTL